jgi:protein-tyrosine phosphatase
MSYVLEESIPHCNKISNGMSNRIDNKPKLLLNLSFINKGSRSQLSPLQVSPLQNIDYDASLITRIGNSNIYLGSLENSLNKELHTKLNITAIVSVIQNEHILCDDQEYSFLHIPIADSSSVPILDYFKTFEDFIEEQINNNRNILVHCHMGISRSATLLISYLMKKLNMNFKNAYDYVKQKRPQVDPNFGFCCNLLHYERQLFPDSESSLSSPKFNNTEVKIKY